MDRPQELNKLESHLGRLRPSPLAIDRDRMMYLAGQAAAGVSTRRRIAQTASFMGLLGLCLALGSMLVWERGKRFGLEQEVATRSREAEPTRVELVVSHSEPSPSSYLMLTRHGVASVDPEPLPDDPASLPLSGTPYRESPLTPLSARRRGLTSEF